MNKIVNRCAVVALVMAINTCFYGDTINVEDNNYQEEINNNVDFNSIEEFLYERVGADKNVISSESTNRLIGIIRDYLGDMIYVSLTNVNGNIDNTILYNDEGKRVEIKYNYDKTLTARYSEDNWFVDLKTNGKNVVNGSYYALDEDKSFYCNESNNSYLYKTSIIYRNEDKSLYITLNSSTNTLYFGNNYDKSYKIELEENDYNNLLLVMIKYEDGCNLKDFLLESELSKYLDILAIKNMDLYNELIEYDITNTLKIKTL